MTVEISAQGSAIELAMRNTWAIARIGELVNAGRQGGWLQAGKPLSTPDVTSIVETCSNQIKAVCTPMGTLATNCGLTAIEMDALWLLACIELEPRVTRVLRLLTMTGGPEMSAQLLERAVFGERTHRDAATFLPRLREMGLVECSDDMTIPLQRRSVRVSDRVLELARGSLRFDSSLRGFASLENSRGDARVSSAVENALSVGANALVILCGASEKGRDECAHAAARSHSNQVVVVHADALATDKDTAKRQARRIARECLLHGATPIIKDIDLLGARGTDIAQVLLDIVRGPTIATATATVAPSTTQPTILVQVKAHEWVAAADDWRLALPTASPDLIDQCASTIRIASTELEQVAASIRCCCIGAASPSLDDVKQALRSGTESKLSGIAKRIVVTQTWDDLVLPVEEFDLLLELCGRVRYRDQVLDEWGFANKVGRGTGITALMSGPPGTGKTMIAGLLANELGLDLYQIDLSKIVSKYIGETEKQLAAVFDAADAGHAVLLFDEADSLFGKRTEVKSSNDRYANLETNFLLQRIESFTGIAILTTNHESAIDPAFKRRLTTHIRVPTPERRQREELWKAMMPKQAKVSGELDFARLAQDFEMSGGYIKNATLRAALLAAAERKPISTSHLLRAARAEYQGMGRIALG